MKLILSLSLLLLALPIFADDKKEDPDLLYQQAVIPWEQGQQNSWELMVKAADAGSSKAQCLIAKNAAESVWSWSEITYKYFKMAADQNAYCGLMSFSFDNEVAMPVVRPKAYEEDGITMEQYRERLNKAIENGLAKGDLEAMRVDGFINDDADKLCDYYKLASEKGDANAMAKLSYYIKSKGCGWYLIPGSRDKAVRYWTEQSAKHGNPKSMEQMMTYAEKENNIDILMKWLNKALDTGNVNSVMLYGEYMTGGELVSQQLPPEKRDAVKGYGAFYAITKKIAPNEEYFYYTGSVKRLAALDKTLSPEQIANAKKWAEEWMKTHQVRDYSLVFH